MKKQIFTVEGGTYPFKTMVCIGSAHAEVVKALKKIGRELNEDEKESLWMRGVGRTVILKGNIVVLRLDFQKDQSEFYGTLAHEVFHAVELVFSRVGIFHDCEKSGEAFAYQIGHITQQIYKKLKHESSRR